ncbi:MAG: hypothetical protein ABIL66_08860 [candidate division WOR-3 bacterium]
MKGTLLLIFCLGLAAAGFLSQPCPNLLSNPILSQEVDEIVDRTSDFIYEDFESGFNHDWEFYDSDIDCGLTNGVLKVDNITNSETGRLWYMYLLDYEWDAMLIDVDFKIEETGYNARVGIIMGLNSAGDFFRLRVDINGTCDFYLHNEEPFEWHKLAESKISPLVIDKWYRMRVVVQQDKVSFSVDGTPALELDCRKYCFKNVANNGEIISQGNLYENIRGCRVGIYAVESQVIFDNFYCKKLISEPAVVKRYGKENLRNDLKQLTWRYDYKINVFDCSNQSLILGYALRELGWNCLIAAGNGHAWLLVETSPGAYTAVEATTISIRNDYPQYQEVGTLEEMQQKYPWDYNFPYEGPYLFCKR